jgi:hypothetical protein
MPEHPQSPRLGSTSRPYIIRRLQDLGLHGLVAAIGQGRVSAHTVGVEMGWIRRPALHGGSISQAHRRQYQVDVLIREGLFDVPARQED